MLRLFLVCSGLFVDVCYRIGAGLVKVYKLLKLSLHRGSRCFAMLSRIRIYIGLPEAQDLVSAPEQCSECSMESNSKSVV